MAVGHRARSHVLDRRRSARARCGGSTNGTTRPPCRKRIQRIGRPNVSSPRPSSSQASQRICFGNARSRSVAAEDVRQHVHGRLAALVPRVGEIAALWASRPSRAPTGSTPALRAKPIAAGVGCAVGPNAADTGGPVTCSSRSVWRSEMRAIAAVSRRGVACVSIGAPAPMRKRPSCAAEPLAELPRQRRQPAGRQFLAPDLEQQFTIHGEPDRPAGHGARLRRPRA